MNKMDSEIDFHLTWNKSHRKSLRNVSSQKVAWFACSVVPSCWVAPLLSARAVPASILGSKVPHPTHSSFTLFVPFDAIWAMKLRQRRYKIRPTDYPYRMSLCRPSSSNVCFIFGRFRVQLSVRRTLPWLRLFAIFRSFSRPLLQIFPSASTYHRYYAIELKIVELRNGSILT
jgi:hypothetical protein